MVPEQSTTFCLSAFFDDNKQRSYSRLCRGLKSFHSLFSTLLVFKENVENMENIPFSYANECT